MDVTCLLWGKRGQGGNLFYNAFSMLSRIDIEGTMKMKQWLKAKSPFYEIPIEELDLPVRQYNACVYKNITTVRAALDFVRAEDDSSQKAFSKLVDLVRRALDDQDYFDGVHPDYYHLVSFPNRLAWLAQTQNPEGHWGRNEEQTIGATLSFIREGHTSTQGEYAPIVARGVRWLEWVFSGTGSRFSDDNLSPLERRLRYSLHSGRPLKNSTITYGLLCVLAENYDMPRPIAPFEPPPTTNFKSVIEARHWALLIGNAPLYGWSDGGWNTFESKEEDYDYSCYPTIEFTWMTVGAPKPTAR
jgi:hypothetical protein